MKKIIGINIILVIALFAGSVQAYAAVPSEKPVVSTASAQKDVGEKLNQQINQLKERIASRVAELNLVEKRGFIGTVTEASDTQVKLTDLNGKIRFVDVDEITKFTSPDNKNFGISDLTKNTKVSVVGLYNKQSQRILARFIDEMTMPSILSGTVLKIDKKNFVVTVTTAGNKEKRIDIETSTKINSYSKDTDLERSGFSKLQAGDRVVVTGFENKRDKDLYTGTLILQIADAPQDPKVKLAEPTTTEKTKAATKSGR